MAQTPTIQPVKTAEALRLDEARAVGVPWRQWGPYLSERQWGTVPADYSHDHARSRAYHWGEDGLAGISDDKRRLYFSLALWNGEDPILKERVFGLTNSEANHGEQGSTIFTSTARRSTRWWRVDRHLWAPRCPGSSRRRAGHRLGTRLSPAPGRIATMETFAWLSNRLRWATAARTSPALNLSIVLSSNRGDSKQ